MAKSKCFSDWRPGAGGRSARLACAALAAWLAVAAAHGESVAELNARGLERLNAGDYPAACEAFAAARAQADDAAPEQDSATLKSNHALALNAWGVALAAGREFDAAAGKFALALALAPDRAEIRSNLMVTRINWAGAAVDAGDIARAEALLNEAATTAAELAAADGAPADETASQRINQLRARNFVIAARAQRERKEPRQERELLERAVACDPQNTHALVRLGEIAYEEGDNLTALEHWRAAERVDPAIEGLAQGIAKLAREAETEGDFAARANAYFLVTYEGESSDDAARAVLAILTKARFEIGGELDCLPRRRLAVVLYTREQYASVTLAPHWSSAGFDGKIRVPAPQGRLDRHDAGQLRQMLYHEYTHALVRDLTGQTPPPSWFNEGLATYYELPKREREQRYEKEWGEVQALSRAGRLISARDLPVQFSSIADAAQARQAYLIARTFATWLANRYRAGKFKTVLQEMEQGAEFEAALRAAFGKDLDTLELEWRLALASRSARR